MRDKVREKDDERGLGEFRRLQCPDALQSEPAVRFAVEEKNQQLKEQHHSERSEGPSGTLQHAIVAALEEHQGDEGKRRPYQLMLRVVITGIDPWIELRHHGRCAVDHHQSHAYHGDHGSKQQPIRFHLLRHYWFSFTKAFTKSLKMRPRCSK